MLRVHAPVRETRPIHGLVRRASYLRQLAEAGRSAGGRPALALMALAGRIEAGGRGGRSPWGGWLST